MIYFTSDLHLSHKNIIKYCGRQFSDCEDMHKTIIDNWNSVIRPQDTVFHLGDFCFSRGNCNKPYIWEQLLNGKIVFIKGNHDRSNEMDGLQCAVLNQTRFNFFLIHKPPHKRKDIPSSCHVVLCGHIHEKWEYQMIDDIPIINVGVDIHEFKPLNIQKIYSIVDRIKKENSLEKLE